MELRLFLVLAILFKYEAQEHPIGTQLVVEARDLQEIGICRHHCLRYRIMASCMCSVVFYAAVLRLSPAGPRFWP